MKRTEFVSFMRWSPLVALAMVHAIHLCRWYVFGEPNWVAAHVGFLIFAPLFYLGLWLQLRADEFNKWDPEDDDRKDS